jgi:hypothetical protein
MAEVFTPLTLVSLTNQTSAINNINNNFAALQTLLTDVLSRSGVTPNTMLSFLDMNSNRILNLPVPSSASEPLRLADINMISVAPGSVTFPGVTTVNSIAIWPNATGNQLSSTSVIISAGSNLSVPGTLGVTGLSTLPTVSITSGTIGASTFNTTGTIIVGGSSASQGLTLQSTLGVGTSDFVKIVVGNNGGTEAARYVTGGQFIQNFTSAITAVTGVIPDHQLHGTTGSTASAATFFWANNTSPATFYALKSRGAAINTRAPVTSGDSLGDLVYAGDDGTNFISAADILGAVDGTVSTGIVPGRHVFRTNNSSGVLTEAMRIDSLQRVGIGIVPASAWLSLPAGTATIASALLTGGSLLTTPVAGAVEFDGSFLYWTPAAAQRGMQPPTYYQGLPASVSYSNVNTVQPWFTNTGTGAITLLGSTTYFFEAQLILTTGATSHNVSVGFGGTATINYIGYQVWGSAGTLNTVDTTLDTGYINTVASTVVLTGGVTTAAWMRFTGTVSINAAGTFIPQFTFSAAPGAGSVVPGTYFKLWPVGTAAQVSIGNWS